MFISLLFFGVFGRLLRGRLLDTFITVSFLGITVLWDGTSGVNRWMNDSPHFTIAFVVGVEALPMFDTLHRFEIKSCQGKNTKTYSQFTFAKAS